MSSKSRPKPAPAKKSSPAAKSSPIAKAAKGAAKVLGMGDGKSRHSKKKTANWYAREIARLKLKKRYEKIKYKV